MKDPNDEIRMTKEIRTSKSEMDFQGAGFRASAFGLLSDFIIRISEFAHVG
jgi:hypothetical protein